MIAYAVTPPAVPMMSPDWLLLTVLEETGKLALVAPPGTVTLGGTVAAVVLSLDKATEKPPAAAGAVSVTVPVAGSPPTTSVGLTFTVDSAGAASAGAARTPAPMTISTPMIARRDSLRCRVDVVNRLVRMEDPPERRAPAGVRRQRVVVRRRGDIRNRTSKGSAVEAKRKSPPTSGSRPPRARCRRPPARDQLPRRSCFGGKAAAPPALSSSMQLSGASRPRESRECTAARRESEQRPTPR